jgi:hypothetical protein
MRKMDRDSNWDMLVVACFAAGALLMIIADLAILIPGE